MKISVRSAAVTAALICLSAPQVVNATNGAWLIGFGAKSRSMGGTGVADNRGGLAAAFNPASMSESGNRFDIGADLFMPPRAIKHESSTLGYTDEESNGDFFLIPNMGGTYEYDDKTTIGFAFVGAGLMTEYNQTVNSDSCRQVNAGAIPGYSNCPPTLYNQTGNAGNEAGVEMIQMSILPSVAYEIDDKNSVGVTLSVNATYFRAEGLEDFESFGFAGGTGDMTAGNWEQSYGLGLRLGYLGKFVDDKLRVGVNYSSRVDMSEFDAYKNLFAEQGDFDIPESYAVGFAFDFTPAITAAFDVQKINWSDVASIGNPGPDAANPSDFFPLCRPPADTTPCLLGGDKGLGFGWKDQTIYKIGVDWQVNDKWSARAGWNYGESPIPADQVLFNMLAPATPEHHLTLGGGYELSEDFVIDASLVYAFSNPINGPTVFGPNGQTVTTGTNASIDMKQLSIGGALGIKF